MRQTCQCCYMTAAPSWGKKRQIMLVGMEPISITSPWRTWRTIKKQYGCCLIFVTFNHQGLVCLILKCQAHNTNGYGHLEFFDFWGFFQTNGNISLLFCHIPKLTVYEMLVDRIAWNDFCPMSLRPSLSLLGAFFFSFILFLGGFWVYCNFKRP